jgi:gluconate 2-dehydrogenase gamma chain
MNERYPRPSRRAVLLTGTAGLALLAFGHPDMAVAQDWHVRLATYQPAFFSEAEWTFLLAATDRLIPEDGEGPGALTTLVPIFIDRQLAGDFGKAERWYMEGPHDPDASPLLGFQSPLTPAEIYRAAIPEIDAHCRTAYGKAFADLSTTDRDKVLADLEKGAIDLKGVSAKTFFAFLLENTREGYFADPRYGGNHGMQAWVYIGFPGARASFREWVGQHNTPYPLGPVSISGERA